MNYSPELKESLLRRMLPPNCESISKIAKEEGISEQTLRNWRDKARADGIAVPNGEASSEDCSTQDKFLIVVETAGMNETDLAEYARKKGLYVEQIKAWRDACMNANGGVAKEAARLSRELKESERQRRILEKEILRKDKALAETAALLVLRKKADAIWGGSRGRMISASDREEAVKLIVEAVSFGACLEKACKEIGITERTYYRWVALNKKTGSFEDLRPTADRPAPANKLSEAEKTTIIETVNKPEYASLPNHRLAIDDKGGEVVGLRWE